MIFVTRAHRAHPDMECRDKSRDSSKTVLEICFVLLQLIYAPFPLNENRFARAKAIT